MNLTDLFFLLRHFMVDQKRRVDVQSSDVVDDDPDAEAVVWAGQNALK